MSSASAKATLLGLGILFLLPLVIAWLMYSGVIDYRPGETRNRGELVEPPVEAALSGEFDRQGLRGHWMLVYPVSLDCLDRCREELVGLRQVQRALGRDSERVRAALLATEDSQADILRLAREIDPGFVVLAGSADALRAQLSEIGGGRGTYVVDPLGNIMMHYHPGTDPDDIRHDLERLLKYGKTDPR